MGVGALNKEEGASGAGPSAVMRDMSSPSTTEETEDDDAGDSEGSVDVVGNDHDHAVAEDTEGLVRMGM